MSAVEYTRCDGKYCGNVTPDDPKLVAWDTVLGWGQLVVGGKHYDLCPECSKKALEAVGIKKD